jgi:transposase
MAAGRLAHHAQSRHPAQHHADLAAIARPELNPVENVWQYLRANWLSNRVFETFDDIVDAACEAWRNLIARPEVITSIGMRDWDHVGQSP